MERVVIVTIPYTDSMTFLDVDIHYDVVATAGPPNPPLEVTLTGWTLAGAWCVDPDSDDCVKAIDVCDDFDQFVSDYYETAQQGFQEICRDFELTSAESVV